MNDIFESPTLPTVELNPSNPLSIITHRTQDYSVDGDILDNPSGTEWFWNWRFIVSPQLSIPNLVSTTDTISISILPANFSVIGDYPVPGEYILEVEATQKINTVYVITETLEISFLVTLNEQSQSYNTNTLIVQAEEFIFDLDIVGCSYIMAPSELLKLGTYDDATSCSHINGTDSISIIIGADSTMINTDHIDIFNTSYFSNTPYYRVYLYRDIISHIAEIIGSVQTINYLFPPKHRTAGDSCADLLLIDTDSLIGVGATCSMPDDYTLIIKYGYGYSLGGYTIQLSPSRFNTPITSKDSFPRPYLPNFTIVRNTPSGNQDSATNIIINGINNNNQSNMLFTWTYISGSDPKPDITGNITTFTFNHSEMKEGSTYEVKIKMTDPGNPNYYMEKHSGVFTVLSSCSTNNCDSATWTFGNSPGNCLSECVTGHNPIVDFFEFTSSSTFPYKLTARYLPGSSGGNVLYIHPVNNNNLNNVQCAGNNLKFPTISINENSPIQCVQLTTDITLSALIISNGLIYGTDYVIGLFPLHLLGVLMEIHLAPFNQLNYVV